MRVGLLGVGTVGSGTCRVLARNHALIRDRAGRPIELAMVGARNVARAREVLGPGIAILGDAMQVVRHPDVDAVVEAIGGCGDARTLVLEAIRHGKHVVTANKALLAQHGEEVFSAARAHGVMVAFEGAVAASIPIVKALREGLAANRIEWLAGIVNGTSNYVLTEMLDKGVTFDRAVRDAQALGYAEVDPALDVNGIDAAHKLALLAAIAFGDRIDLEGIDVAGVADLRREDLALADRLGYRLKLLALARRRGQALELRVRPTLVPERSLLAHTEGVMNAVLVEGDACGPALFQGAGAGSEQTASAVIAALIDIARQERVTPAQRVPAFGLHAGASRAWPRIPASRIRSGQAFFVPLRSSAAVQETWRSLHVLLADRGLVASGRAEEGPLSGFLIDEQPRAVADELALAIARLRDVAAPVRVFPVEILR